MSLGNQGDILELEQPLMLQTAPKYLHVAEEGKKNYWKRKKRKKIKVKELQRYQLSGRGTNPHRARSHPPGWRMRKVSGGEMHQRATLLDLIFFFFYRTSHCNQPHAEKGQLSTGKREPWPCLTDNCGSPELAAFPSPTAWLDNTRQIRSKYFDPSPSEGPI